MKCPKCQYIGFDTGDRCRNCGYEFALMLQPSSPAEATAVEAPLDLPLRAAPQERAEPVATPALPLFSDDDDPDVPLVRTAPPRQPIAVRKTPEAQRQHLSRAVSVEAPKTPTLQFGHEPAAPETKSGSVERRERPLAGPAQARPAPAPAARAAAPGEAPVRAGSLGARCAAAVIDFALLFGIDLVVLHFTLRLTALTFAEWRSIPLVPLLVFLIGLKLAYLATFTLAGGQTIGKMAAGLRVVSEEAASLAPWTAVQRALVEVASVAACGVPFLLALGDPARRGLHDRVARTRVVPVS